MYLSRITVSNFKNISEADLCFSPKLNCISGNNGGGKTNLLDAVHYLCMTKSYFHFPDQFSIHHGCNMAGICGTYVMDDATSDKIAVALYGKNVKEDKIVKKNDKIYKRLSEHVGVYPIVMVSPSDGALINLGGEERRRFINQLLSQTDKEYLRMAQSYNKFLAQRNKLLKDENMPDELLETIGERMEGCAEYIFDSRKKICGMLSESITYYYSRLCGGNEQVRMIYDTQLGDISLTELFAKNIERDRMFRYTTAGVHKDDFLFEISGCESGGEFYPVKRCASQGQQKCFLVALKLAQFSIMRELCGGGAPILLLDDIFDKLDMSRVEHLLSLVSGDSFGQIFVTDSNKVRLNALIEKIGSECRNFEVCGGVISEAV